MQPSTVKMIQRNYIERSLHVHAYYENKKKQYMYRKQLLLQTQFLSETQRVVKN